jgi:Fe(3+) dicitrate transport protein
MYGYPASHYNQPMESIKNIELVRGTAALQYGAQFGGMINYITKTAPQSKKFEFESINSVGSYGLLSSYNAAGGNIGKLSYYAYFHRRVSDGYRKNGRSDANSQYLNLNYQFTGDISLKATLARSVYQYQLPGPLTDAMFAENPRQSTRFRNHYSPEIFIPSFSFSWNISENTFLEATSSAILGNRNSVLFIGFANKPDTINSQRQENMPTGRWT